LGDDESWEGKILIFKNSGFLNHNYIFNILYLSIIKIGSHMKKLRIHYFQHVAFEKLGSIEEWISVSGHSLTVTRFFENATFPEISDFDWLIVMGGSMSVHNEEQYPWLADEKKFIRQAIDAGKTVIGICLGSQLVSVAIGAKVYQNKEKEIGWFEIELDHEAQSASLFSGMGHRLIVFHWHGDTFDLPENAIHIASSDGTRNQAYIYKGKVLAMQFHLESTLNSLQQMIDHGRNELSKGKYVQTEEEILTNKQLIESNKKVLFKLLERLAENE
jgi:GMP synthase-like glutamine amidotransferase